MFLSILGIPVNVRTPTFYRLCTVEESLSTVFFSLVLSQVASRAADEYFSNSMDCSPSFFPLYLGSFTVAILDISPFGPALSYTVSR